ncbi:transporter substrate-binding domain-containing protein [Pectobacterium punjabense]|uniref:transporter substrate-binding domain-containing protein n=1 Tax=Pectobacterium punjabense TaxID=2108399 RepID=UPI002406FC5D|nr:transporter substrate-binding domain-containing protein [Pectobacterium punjabense]MDG0798781.1 transporter substrate-binding domain-containing protein [Pectobacterium punjabense]
MGQLKANTRHRASLFSRCITPLFLFSVFSAVSPEATAKLTIAMDGASPPYNYSTSNGKIEGFEVDLINDLCKRINEECTVVSQSWEGIIPALLAKRYDAIMSGISITEERKKQIDFTHPYSTTPSWLVGSEAMFKNITTSDAAIAALKGKSLGVQRGTIQQAIADNTFRQQGVEIKEYDTDDNLKIDLEAGRLDAVLGVSVNLTPLLEGQHQDTFIRFGPEITDEGGIGIALRKDEQALKEKLNNAIDAAIHDGTVSALSIKWLKFDSIPKTPSA